MIYMTNKTSSIEKLDDSLTSLTIGSLRLQSRFILAPMEGVSDIGFRRLCYAQGAGLTWTEMVRASGIIRKNKATLDLIDTYDISTPTGVQLFVVNERELLAALQTLELLAATTHPHFNNIIAVDLNFGCPSPDLIKIGAGPALMKRAVKMETIFKTLHEWKKTTKLPIGAIGAKIRLGMNAQEQEYKIYLRIIPAANKYLDYLMVHARHAKQKSKDPVTWSAITEIKMQSTIPIIGNGDVFSALDAENMFSSTHCDGILIARGAITNPWIFRELREYLERNSLDKSQKENKEKTEERIEEKEKIKEKTEKKFKKEIILAREEYFAIAKKYNTKEKYIAFHEENFKKLLQI